MARLYSRLLSAALLLSLLPALPVSAQPAPEADDDVIVDSSMLKLPEFDPQAPPEETLKTVEELWQTRIDVETPTEANLLKIRVLEHIIKGAETIVGNDDAKEEVALKAVQNKMEALGVLAQAGDPAATQKAIAMARDLAEDKRPLLAREGKLILLSSRLAELQTMDDQGRLAFVNDLMGLLKTAKISGREVQIASITADILEQLGDLEAAKSLYTQLAEEAKKAESPETRTRAEEFAGAARRLSLPGSEIKIDGETLAGEKFDIKNHRGKVVLVQFWASWCGYCLQEMPNIKQMYNTYHEDGFEVIGVNLDESAERASAIVSDMKLPWPSLFSSDPTEQGMENPNATYYGISSIPQCILVDREGKVVTLNARGEELNRQLERLFLENAPKTPETTESTPASEPAP